MFDQQYNNNNLMLIDLESNECVHIDRKKMRKRGRTTNVLVILIQLTRVSEITVGPSLAILLLFQLYLIFN